MIDDDATIRELITRVLTSFGHTVVLANDGEEGCEIAKLSRPTVILCDAMLPDRIGFDVIHELKAMPGFTEVPVIFVTGYAYIQQSMPNFENCYWLLKPFQ